MILSQIVAVSKNGVIGKNNTLPWHLPEDLKFFREKTKGKILIMGRKTFESLPHPLKGRYHMVVSRSAPQRPVTTTAETPVEFFTSFEAAVAKAKKISVPSGTWPEEVFVAGGTELFRMSFPIIDRIYLTKIHHDVDGDIYYPDLDFSQLNLADQSDRQEPFPYSFLLYTRPS
ncbi:MAG: dihydrofolate reductase [Bdellovibrionota bacterium]